MWPEIMLSELKHDIPIILKQYSMAVSSIVVNKIKDLSSWLQKYTWFKASEMKMLLFKQNR